MRGSIAAAGAALVLSACATPEPDRGAMDRVTPRQVWIVGAQEGAAIGQATFTEGPRGVMIRLQMAANSLTPGWHGLHLHGVGDCSDRAAGFQASGAHVGHGDGPQHGLMNPAGPEPGDLPNIYAPEGAAFGAEIYVPGATLANDLDDRGRFELLDRDGAALLIHAGPDDHQTQPIGGAGARIACAALTPLP